MLCMSGLLKVASTYADDRVSILISAQGGRQGSP